MANHRTPKRRRARKAFVSAAVAAGLSGTLVLGHALDNTAEHLDPALAAIVFGIGGLGDATSARVPDKLGGDIGPGFSSTYDYVAIPYPADFNFQSSTDAGVATLKPLLITTSPSGDVQVTAYSEGTLVAEQVKRELAAANYPNGTDKVTYLLIASPYVPNGGVFARFPGFTIPGLLPVFSAAQPTKNNSTYVINEYDPYADSPAYLNPLAMANSLLAIEYAHPDPYYDNIDPTDPTKNTTYTTTVTNNGAGGTDTYILVYNPQLPLFGPIRQIEAAVPALTPFVEPAVSGMEPLARVFVDMGYTDRQNLNPATPTPFSFVTPPEKLAEALAQVPGALEQGLKNMAAGHDVTPRPASETHTQTSPGVDAVAPDAQSKPGSDVTTLQQPNTQKEDIPNSKPTVDPKKQDKGLDKLVDRIIHPTVTSDGGKVSPTTTAPTNGFGKEPGAKLLKNLFGSGNSTSTAPESTAPESTQPESPKPESAKPDNTKSESAAA